MRKSISVAFFSLVSTLMVLGIVLMGASEWVLFKNYFAKDRYETLDQVVGVTQRTAQYLVQQAELPEGDELDALSTKLEIIGESAEAYLFFTDNDGRVMIASSPDKLECLTVPEEMMEKIDASDADYYHVFGTLGGMLDGKSYITVSEMRNEHGQPSGYLFLCSSGDQQEADAFAPLFAGQQCGGNTRGYRAHAHSCIPPMTGAASGAPSCCASKARSLSVNRSARPAASMYSVTLPVIRRRSFSSPSACDPSRIRCSANACVTSRCSSGDRFRDIVSAGSDCPPTTMYRAWTLLSPRNAFVIAAEIRNILSRSAPLSPSVLPVMKHSFLGLSPSCHSR